MLVEIDTAKVRGLRMAALLTREELHTKSGVSRSTISKLEVSKPGVRIVRLETAKGLAKALGIEPQELIVRVPELVEAN